LAELQKIRLLADRNSIENSYNMEPVNKALNDAQKP